MSTIIQGYLLRTSLFGTQVVKASQSLPQNATATLATVNSGMIMITSMLGIVTTAIGATATTLSVGTVPTFGAASTTGIGAATPITSTPIGSWIVPVQSAGVAGQLAVGANAGTAVFLPTDMVVSAGLITWTTNANNTGAIRWYFTYVPIDTAAYLS